jgi:hypothetical protein
MGDKTREANVRSAVVFVDLEVVTYELPSDE